MIRTQVREVWLESIELRHSNFELAWIANSCRPISNDLFYGFIHVDIQIMEQV